MVDRSEWWPPTQKRNVKAYSVDSVFVLKMQHTHLLSPVLFNWLLLHHRTDFEIN